MAAVNGVATFSNLLLDTAGTYTLSAGEGSLTGATSGNIVVTAAGGLQARVPDGPRERTAGTLEPGGDGGGGRPERQRPHGNTSTVTLAVASGPGGFATGSTTSVAAVNGVATFSNLLLDTAGTLHPLGRGWFAHRCHQRQHRGHCGRRLELRVPDGPREPDGRHA